LQKLNLLPIPDGAILISPEHLVCRVVRSEGAAGYLLRILGTKAPGGEFVPAVNDPTSDDHTTFVYKANADLYLEDWLVK
jgi:hypothetical protein